MAILISIILYFLKKVQRALPSQKSLYAPNAHLVEIALDTAQGACPLTHYPPALKGAREGSSSFFPAGTSVSAPPPSRVKMNRGKPLPLTPLRLSHLQVSLSWIKLNAGSFSIINY